MNVKPAMRPGGRSARIQAAVHEAASDLLAKTDRSQLTVPLIAAQAGVTPSTIYRRWGDLAELLADVAVARLRPATDPADTGTAKGDLVAWVEQYMEEMSSEPGRAMIRDVLATESEVRNAGQCCAYTTEQLQIIADRAKKRGEMALDVDAVADHVIAPIMYRILFSGKPLTHAYCRALIERVLSQPAAKGEVTHS
jgi:AcrR family transcriptional regulator